METKDKTKELTDFWAGVRLEVARAIGLGDLETKKLVDDLGKVLDDRNAIVNKKNEELTEQEKVALAKRFAEIDKDTERLLEVNRKRIEKENEKQKELNDKFLKEFKERNKEFFAGQAEVRAQAYGDQLDQQKDQQDKELALFIQGNKLLEDEQERIRQKDKSRAQKEFDNTIKLAKEGNREAIEQLKLISTLGITVSDEAQEALKEIAKKNRDQLISDIQSANEIIFKSYEEAFQKRQDLLEEEIGLQEQNIETQRRLAEQGLTNTLAFEEKRAAELRRQQQVEAERQKRVKLLETFLNSLAEFSKADPKTAIQKALLQVALAQAATAVFAEEGGIIGEIGERSNLSRRHKGGGDVLLHAQTGEGILSRREMDNLGRRNFHLLKDAARFPIKDNVFAMPQISIAGGVQVSNADVVKELKTLQKVIKNKRESSYNLDEFGNYVKKQVENGVTTVTKGKLRKPRFK